MAITVTHTKVSLKPDDSDESLIRPSDWNATHALSGTVPVANGGTGAATLTGYVYGNGTAAMTASTTVPSTAITGLGTMSTQNANAIAVTGGSMSGVTISDYIPTTQKAAALGVATLDSATKVPISQIPDSVIGALSYQGTWNASTNTPTLVSATGTKGYYYVVSVAGSTNLDGITDWKIGDWAVYSGTAWQKIDNTDSVTSVNGYTGAVVLTAADVSAVPYTGATAAVDLNNKSLTDISHLGVNTTTVPDILIRAFGDNNSTSRIAIRGYSSDANSSSIRVAKFRGTYAAPQAPQSGDSLGKFELAGYGTTSSNGYPQASLEGLATEAWGATARGAKAVIKVTPNTTTTQVTALTIDQNSAATFASTVTANGVLLTGNTGTVTSVAATAGTGISVSGSPITTSGTLTITNTAPDQTVAITAGTGISVTGTYPNFSVTNTSPSSGGTVTSVTGTAPVVSSGGATPAISMPAATTSVSGYLTSTDWTTFNNKGSGTVTSVSATAPITSSGGATPNLAMPAATTSVNGYLTSTDWTIFNNKGSGSVTSVAQSFTGGLISVSGSPITTSGTLALTVAGTSGGIPYFSSSSAWASSAALTQYGVVYGGGAGAAPVATAAGTTGQVLTATTSGAPTWAAVSTVVPQITTYTSGSGTYTTPANCKYLSVKMVGGGSGGAGGNNGSASTSGGNTTFGSSFLTANGASGSTSSTAGAGGTATGGDLNVQGGYGSFGAAVTGGQIVGGTGAASFFGGNGAGVNNSAGTAAVGYGSGGGGGNITTGYYNSGCGGSSGGYLEKTITSPSSSYSYAVGAGGAGASSTGQGSGGGDGFGGVIIVTAYF